MKPGPKGGTAGSNPAGSVGTRYGRLVIDGPPLLVTRSDGRKRARYPATCDCGVHKDYLLSNLTSGMTNSCGCLHREVVSQTMTTHGASRAANREGQNRGVRGTRLYRVWKAMRDRCYRKTASNYHWYGGKGIKVCAEWNDFAVFHDWALTNGYEDGLTIERKDSNGDYHPDNCEWIPARENARRGSSATPRTEKGVWRNRS